MQLLTIDDTQQIVDYVVDHVKRAVVATMGPNGKLAVIANGSAVKVTKDGVTVAKSIKFDDARHELINRVITEAAIKTDHECGDGTTTTVMLTAELYKLFCAYPSYLDQKFIEEVVTDIIEELKGLAITVTIDDPRLFKLALTSSNNDAELSQLVCDIYKASGDRYPEIELKEGQASNDVVVRSNGLPIAMYLSNPGFAKNGNGADTPLTNFYPILVDGPLGRGVDLADTLIALDEKYEGGTVVIMARSIEHETVQQMLRLNNNTRIRKEKRAQHQVIGPVGAHFIGINTNAGGSVGSLIMQDIATMFSAPVFSQLEDSVEADIPSVDSVLTVNTTRSILSELSLEQQGKLNARADEIALELGGYELGDRFSVRAKFNEKRIRNLRGELVTIFVGGETYSDVKERIDRFEDVVKAVKSALVNGVVPGVGSSLVTAGARAIMKQTTALSIPDVSKALFGSLDILSGKFKPATEEEINVQFQILLKLALLCWSPYLHLMSQVDGKPMKNPASTNTIGGDIIPNCVNLATGAKGTSEELGVYDTAFATITALKGGLQTAKILANASSILLGEKLSAVRVNV